jgi:hypothetical protein
MALTDELSFRLGDTGVILNTDAGFPFVDIDSVKGLDSAPFRMTQRDHEGDDGGYIDAEFEKGRDIVLSGTAYTDTALMEQYLDSLKYNWAPSTSLIPFYFKSPGRPERFLYVKPLGVRYDWDTMRRLGQAAVQFSAFAEDPRIYELTAITAVINLGATVYTGFGFPFGFPFGFGGVSTTTDEVTVTNSGNRPTPPLLTIAGPVTNPRILNDTLSKEMVFTITLLAGETLVVDPKNKTVRLNGVTNRRNTLQAPTWFYLAVGANSIRYRAESSDPTSTLTITFRPAWR